MLMYDIDSSSGSIVEIDSDLNDTAYLAAKIKQELQLTLGESPFHADRGLSIDDSSLSASISIILQRYPVSINDIQVMPDRSITVDISTVTTNNIRISAR